jgi:hypothetical protein
MRISNPWRHAWLALPLALLLGCGKSDRAVRATGRVTNAGEPLRVMGREMGLGMVQIQFFRIDDGSLQASEAEGTVANEDGQFEVCGREGKGITPGRYRIAVRQWDPYPQCDRLGGRFSEDNSPIIREVTGREAILIDLARPDG